MTYARRRDDLSVLPMSPETVARLRALGVNTVGQMFDDPHGIEEASEWNDALIEAGTGYSLLDWGAELPARRGELYWALEEDGTLTIYGNGYMLDYTNEAQTPWFPYREEIRCVCFCDGVKHIGALSFAGCPALGFLELSMDVTRIGTRAFQDCPELEVVFSEKPLVNWREEPLKRPEEQVIYVGQKAFAGTPLLRRRYGDFYITQNILMEYFGNSRDVIIPEGVEEIAPMVFEDLDLTSVRLPGSLRRIGLCAFQNTHLKKLTLPEKLERVEGWAFRGIQELEQVTLLGRRAEISPDAFAGTPVEACSQPVDGYWRARFQLRQTEVHGLEPFRRLDVAPGLPFGTRTLNVHRAVRKLLDDHMTLIQYRPDWHETGEPPITVYRAFWRWTPLTMESIQEYLPEELRDCLSSCHIFPKPDERRPISTAGLCRTRRKNTPVWYCFSGRDLWAEQVGMLFLEKYYAAQRRNER